MTIGTGLYKDLSELKAQVKLSKNSMLAKRGKLDNTSSSYKDIVIDHRYAYLAQGLRGVQKVDLFSDSFPAEEALNNEPSQDSHSVYAVEQDETYIYTCSRKGFGDDYTTPQISLHCDGKSQDISGGGDGFEGGSKSSENISIATNGQKAPTGGVSGGIIEWTDGSETANAYVDFAGSTDNYADFWIKIGTPTAQDLNNFQFAIFKQVTSRVLRITFAHRTATDDILLQLLVTKADGSTETLVASTNVDYNTWNNFKVHYKIDATTGGGELWHRTNIADDWVSLCSDFTLDTSGKTPDKVEVGIVSLSATYTSGKIEFDEIYADIVDTDTKLYDEGRIDCIRKSDMVTVSTIKFEAKCTDIYKLGDLLLVANQLKGVDIVDITDPTNMRHIQNYYGNGTVEMRESVGCCGHDTGTNKYMYVANYYYGLRILDITDPSNPIILNTIPVPYVNLPTDAHTLWNCAIDYPYVYCTVNVTPTSVVGTDYDKRGFMAFDLTDPIKEKHLYIEFPENAKDIYTSGDSDPRPTRIAIDGDVVYIANGTVGITAYDIKERMNPKYIGSYITGEDTSIWAVGTNNNTVLAGDGAHATGTRALYTYIKTLNI